MLICSGLLNFMSPELLCYLSSCTPHQFYLTCGLACPRILHVSRVSFPYVPLCVTCSQCLMVLPTPILGAIEPACFRECSGYNKGLFLLTSYVVLDYDFE